MICMNGKKNYYAIIPASVRYDDELSDGTKLLYGEITALSNEKGYCWASDSYFAELYNVSKSTIQRRFKQLEEKGYIKREIVYEKGTRKIAHRYTHLCDSPIRKNEHSPIRKNERDNITDINTTLNNTVNKRSSRKRVYDEDSVYYQLALRLYKKILENNPEHKKPNLQNWANDVRLMIERDNRTEEQIAYLIDWVQNDSFWKSNILSIKKLREKYDQLVIRVKEDIKRQNKQSIKKEMPRAYQSLQDWAEEG